MFPPDQSAPIFLSFFFNWHTDWRVMLVRQVILMWQGMWNHKDHPNCPAPGEKMESLVLLVLTSRVQFLSFSITCISCFSLFLQGADEPKGPPGLLDQMTVITHWYSLIVTTLNIISWNNINALTTAILMCNWLYIYHLQTRDLEATIYLNIHGENQLRH